MLRLQDWHDTHLAQRPWLVLTALLGVLAVTAVLVAAPGGSVTLPASAWLLIVVAASAVGGGWRLGLLATGLSAVILGVLVIPPVGSAGIDTVTRTWALVLFVIAGCGISGTVGALDRAIRAVRQVNRMLRTRERRARQVANALQRSLLPNEPPRVPGLQVVSRYFPADVTEVGGDFYDWLYNGCGELHVLIGDVCGKGPAAAARAALARYTLRATAMIEAEPVHMLQRLNSAILAEGDDRYCTAAVMRLQLGAPAMAHVTLGGHPPVLLLRDQRALPVGRPGSLIGVFEDIELHHDTVDLQPGDRLFLYTDGVTDRPDGSLVDDDQLRDLLVQRHDLNPWDFARSLEEELLAVPGGRDDLAFVLITLDQPASRDGLSRA